MLEPIQFDGELMWVSVDLCVVPIGVGVSLSPYIAACERVIAATGLTHQLGPNGTAIEGPWGEVMDCVRACHAELHGMGAPRLTQRSSSTPAPIGSSRLLRRSRPWSSSLTTENL